MTIGLFFLGLAAWFLLSCVVSPLIGYAIGVGMGTGQGDQQP